MANGTDNREPLLLTEFRNMLCACGMSSLKALGRVFNDMDKSGDKTLDFNEFLTGVRSFIILDDEKKAQDLFKLFDKDGSGTLDYHEFTTLMEGSLTPARRRLVENVFDAADVNWDRRVTQRDLEIICTGDFAAFLKEFDDPAKPDGVITFTEFMNYFAAVSATIQDEDKFVERVVGAWSTTPKSDNREPLLLTEFRNMLCMFAMSSIKELGRLFHVMDESGDKQLDLTEFTNGIQTYLPAEKQDKIQELFKYFDKDGSGTVDYKEFIAKMQWSLSPRRRREVEEVFFAAAANWKNDGFITQKDLEGIYKGDFAEFLKSFDDKANPDGKVTYDEFMNYYVALSSTINDDEKFTSTLNETWKFL